MKTLLLDADENFGWKIVRGLTIVREVVACSEVPRRPMSYV
jgi:hypothetical protein